MQSFERSLPLLCSRRSGGLWLPAEGAVGLVAAGTDWPLCPTGGSGAAVADGGAFTVCSREGRFVIESSWGLMRPAGKKWQREIQTTLDCCKRRRGGVWCGWWGRFGDTPVIINNTNARSMHQNSCESTGEQGPLLTSGSGGTKLLSCEGRDTKLAVWRNGGLADCCVGPRRLEWRPGWSIAGSKWWLGRQKHTAE